MNESTLDHAESLIIAATVEVMAALDRGTTGEVLESGMEFIRNLLFVETATLTRSVDAAETAVQRFADKVASIQFCDACQRHRINGRCITCVIAQDMAALTAANQNA